MPTESSKTSIWTRILIIVVAILLLGSSMIAYMLIVMNGNNSSTTNNDQQIAELTAEYDAKTAELEEAAKPLSGKYFSDFSKYKSNVKSFNAASANADGLKTKDLKTGTGKELASGDTNYSAYYIGWCADGTIFDSSFNDNDNPTSLKPPVDASAGLIEGWNQGVVGMKLGGVRELSIAGSLAYGESREICGGTNSPLKFIVMPIATDEKLAELTAELNEIYLKLYSAYYGGAN